MHHDDHAHGDHHEFDEEADYAAAALTIPDETWRHLRLEDYQAGVYVVGLMLAIFSIGVILYTIVAVSVANG
jgi:hypothetical protein